MQIQHRNATMERKKKKKIMTHISHSLRIVPTIQELVHHDAFFPDRFYRFMQVFYIPLVQVYSS